MGTADPDPTVARPVAGRLAAIGAAVFLANAGLLILQLAAGRLLAPFVGSSLETWTSIIGAFLAGIAAGNWLGGKAADREPTGRRLAMFLVIGAIAAVWMVVLPQLLEATHTHRLLPLGIRIPVLAWVLCFPAGFALSLPTPLAIRLGLPDVRRAGRVAGVVFALGTLGCLAGNYVTGFYLIPNLTVDTIVLATAGGLLATAGFAVATLRKTDRGGEEEKGRRGEEIPSSSPLLPLSSSPPLLSMRTACLIVFLCSFAGMTLELAAARLMAQVVGVSLYTWTGVIGVMLTGTAAGNWLGGLVADRAARRADAEAGSRVLATSLVLAAGGGVAVLGLFVVGSMQLVHESHNFVNWLLYHSDLVTQVLAWTFALFFPASLMLGTISPQVIRLAVPDVAHAGRVAGRVYAWSTAGAIAGTFATGYVLISTVGVYHSVLIAALLPGWSSLLVIRVWERPLLLYGLSLALGLCIGGFILLNTAKLGIARETNYYTIRVNTNLWPLTEQELASPATEAMLAVVGPVGVFNPPGEILELQLDRLTHSRVKPRDPSFLFYPHEQIQMEFLRRAANRHPDRARTLVVGGGGYTFPRCARTQFPTCGVDVVEIDPGVTAVSYERLGLDPKLGIFTANMDGRQFVAERTAPRSYDLITLDAVNDLTVPYHLLTKEFNDSVKTALTPDGVYLLTVIDRLGDGRLWKAAVHTLRETFPHVQVLESHENYDPISQHVYVIYAGVEPLNVEQFRAEMVRLGVPEPYTHPLPAGEEEWMLKIERPIVLTDQFAPVDNLMANVFRHRYTGAEE